MSVFANSLLFDAARELFGARTVQPRGAAICCGRLVDRPRGEKTAWRLTGVNA